MGEGLNCPSPIFGGYMPKVKEGERRSEYVHRAIPYMMSEGLTQKQAVGKAEGMFDSHMKKQRKKKSG